MSGFNPVSETIASHEDYKQGYYVGTVTNNADPLGFGRVQASVENMFDPSQGEVPWIGPSKDSPYGYGTSAKGQYGVFGAPAVGSKIRVELQNGDEHKALYTTLPTAPNANPAFQNPNTWGFQDPSGNQLLVNMSANSWTWTHASGDSVAYDGSGDVVKVVKGNDTSTINGALTFNVQGNAQIQTQGNIDLQAGGNFTLQASGTASYTAAVHQFNGPVTTSSTLAAAGDITDSTGTGNTRTMATMREIFDTHRHHYDDNGNDNVTDVPFPLT